MALPQRHRLKGQDVFDAIYRRGRVCHGAGLVLRWMPAQASPAQIQPGQIQISQAPSAQALASESNSAPTCAWRCAVVVSTKVHKRAVQRNRLRRQLHHFLLRDFAPEATFGLPPAIWLLISLKPGSAEWDSARLLGECQHLLVQAGLQRCFKTPRPRSRKLSSTREGLPAET